MGELVLIRHGETEWSRTGRHTGRTDIPLTAHGEQQARALAPLLACRRIALVLASPLNRALRTAELAGLPSLRVEPDLREWDYGAYEGVTTDEIHRSRPAWNLWNDGVPVTEDGRGESAEQVACRVQHVLDRADRILRGRCSPDPGDVVLVAHAHVLRVLTARRLDLPPCRGALFQLATASVSSLGTEHDRPVLTGWNSVP
ncbi:histidine phosphatase family protein [Streptacidiphilus carbonis]|jgi:broad specificity phosphatase PhoE|uniref:histidine phosphatase family protein n=1 Tax=Streptacidiphilus carbonis TaxID=105422 RepID=UPI0005A8D515|nr:histidine phosphatase family protein [Streptacidiphilus carbonis]